MRACFLQLRVQISVYLLKVSLVLCLILQDFIFELCYLLLHLLQFPILHMSLFPVLVLHLPKPIFSFIVLISQRTQLYFQRVLLFLDLLKFLFQFFATNALLAGRHSLIRRISIAIIVQATVRIRICLKIMQKSLVDFGQLIDFVLQF